MCAVQRVMQSVFLTISFFELGSLTGPQTYQSAGSAGSELQGSACVHLLSSHPELPVDTVGGGFNSGPPACTAVPTTCSLYIFSP